MSQLPIFRTARGNPVTDHEVRGALDQVGANNSQVLYMHSSLSFGLPNPKLNRDELLTAIYQAV